MDHLALDNLEFSTESLTNEEETALYAQAAERARRIPGVRSATITRAPFRSNVDPGARCGLHPQVSAGSRLCADDHPGMDNWDVVTTL